MSADVETVETAPVEVPKNLQDRAAVAVAAYQAVPIDALVERVNLLKELMKRCMVEGQHHGLDHDRVEQKQFWPHVRRDPLTECWVWVGYRDRKG